MCTDCRTCEEILNRLKALILLSECTGDDIWSIEHCQLRGVPSSWVEELSDCYESGFHHQAQTIFVENKVVNQYHGIRDVDLAIKLGEFLGVSVHDLIATTASRSRLVTAIRDAVVED